MDSESKVPEAWVKMPDADEFLALMRQASPNNPYDFGFAPGMVRLQFAHRRLGAAFGALFSQIMFSDEGVLSRREREMVAAVTAAAQDCHY